MNTGLRASLSVASFTDAWIETVKNRQDNAGEESHLLQMRGLKQITYKRNTGATCVASFTDAWIETDNYFYRFNDVLSHLLQMRGLKLRSEGIPLFSYGRIFYRCVD